MKKRFLCLCLALVIVLGGLTGCGDKKEEVKTTTSTTVKSAKEKIWLTFDTDGGNEIEKMDIDKGAKPKLPTPTKEGYDFVAWYVEDTEVTSDTVFNVDTTLKAKWGKAKKTTGKTFKVTFDSKGGSKVSTITVTCNKELKLPKAPTKDGYTFVSWADKNGVTIHDKALLACENITLYATWEKTTSKTYTCPDGYELKDTKCTITKNATPTCPSGTTRDGELCVKVTDKVNGDRTCPTISIEGHDYQGTKVDAGTTFCYYAPVTSKTTKEECEAVSNGLSIDSDGHYDWRGNKCYKAALTNYTTECPSDYKKYTQTEIQALNSNIHDGGGCYRVSKITYKCDDGFILKDKTCTKTVNATVK